MTRDGFSPDLNPERADDRKAEAKAARVRSQLSHVDRRKRSGARLVSVWMTPDTFALWQALHPQHGGTQQTLDTALRQLSYCDAEGIKVESF
jgi:hypothetical protein